MNTSTPSSLAADLEFAESSGEFTRTAPLLRYVAAINTGATKVEFIAACVTAGYHPNTAAKQFAQSRKFDCDNYGHTVDSAGRLIEAL